MKAEDVYGFIVPPHLDQRMVKALIRACERAEEEVNLARHKRYGYHHNHLSLTRSRQSKDY